MTLIMAMALATAACGSDSAATTAGPEPDGALVDAIVEGMMEDAEPGDPFADPEAARCVAVGMVDDLGVSRLFEIGEIARQRPLEAIAPICRWSGRGRVVTAIYWARLGLARPPALRAEELAVEAVFEAAARDGVARADLLRSVPAVVPLWQESSARRTIEGAGARVRQVRSTTDCVMVVAEGPDTTGENTCR